MAKRARTIPLTRTRTWAPRRAIAPKTRRQGGDLIVTSNGSAGCYGGWEALFRAPRAGQWVRFSANARWRDLERGYDCVNAAVTWLDRKGQMVGWEPVFPNKVAKGHVVYEGRARVPERAALMAARLLIACSANGQIRWSEPELECVAAPRPRRLRLGAAGGTPSGGKATLERNTQFYLRLCEQAARDKIDLLCLPEVMLSAGRPSDLANLHKQACQVPGKETAPFQEFARRNRMALCFSIDERNNELVHNTAILIDKKGKVAGKYRKVHLAQPNEIWRGVTPGHDFPVFKVCGARVAMNICMDSSAAESARVPARKGAEIICLPIMGDHRASSCWYKHPHNFDIDRWQMIQRVRAMDNHVYMVVSRNQGYGTGVFSPRGETLALSGGKPVVWADVDLEDLSRMGGGSTFRGVCWYERREPAYAALAGALLPDPFA
ncbi:MAG: carbon-nitrogen hydrolase family protein [Kiritimatiellae bacterium]|nr:carbon-nitrogen hydrolase family protein [Kiritimatiellia bacterium]